MTEIKAGSVVAFARDNVVKQGTVQKVYEDFDIVLVDVPEDNNIYKVAISDVTVMSEPNDQEPKTEDEKIITITPTEFNSIATDLIKTLPDTDLQTILTMFSNMLSRELFGIIPTK